MTTMPAGGLATGSGETSRRTASAISSTALPIRKADCPSAASGSALPWPKRCSRSAGRRGMPDGEEIDHRGGGVDQRVDEARQQRDRAGAEPGGEFGGDQHHRDRQRGIGRAHPQALRRRGRDRGARSVTERGVPCAMPARSALADEHEPIMQPKRPLLPELDPLGRDAEARPVGRPRHDRLVGILPGELGKAPFERLAAVERPRLVGGPGADLAVARPRREIGVGLVVG